MDRPVRASALCRLAIALLLATLVMGCGGGAKPTAQKSPTAVMAQAKKNLDSANSVHIVLSTDSTPSAGDGVLGATGDITQAPAFAGEVKVVLNGLTATVPITSVGGQVHAKLPLQTKYAVINPSEYGAPDPADFADPENGLSGLLTKLQDLKRGKQTRSASTILTSYSGTLPGAAVKKIIPSAVAAQTYQTVVGVDQKGYARTVKVTGSFFTGNGGVTYNLVFSGYDQGVQITAPAA